MTTATVLELPHPDRAAQADSEWPLNARSEELDFIAHALRRNGGSGVVLAGAAGVGKTRLARESLALVCRRGSPTWWIPATVSARALQFGAFAHLSPSLVDSGGGFRHAATALFAEASVDAVVVDDAHLLDDCSAALLHQFALRRAAPLIVTVRTGEVAPGAITALWKDGHFDWLEVPPLSLEESATLLESVLGGPLESHSSRRLYAAAQGNLRYLRHLVDEALMTGSLLRVGGVWLWRGGPAVSPRLAELVATEIGALSGPVQKVVEALAFGEPLELALLTRLSDDGAVEEADLRGLITVAACGGRTEVRLAHPIYGDVLRARASVLRAQRWCSTIARHLGATARPDDLLRRAVLILESRTEPEPDILASAACAALTRFDLPLAERLARAAMESRADFDAHLALCCSLAWQRRWSEADAEAAGLVSAAVGDEQLTRAAIARAANLFWGLGREDVAEEVLAQAEKTILDVTCVHELAGFRSVMAYGQGRIGDAAALAAGVLSKPEARDGAVTWAALGAAGSLGLHGRADRVHDAVVRGRATAGASFETAWFGFALSAAEVGALRLAGRLTEAERLTREIAAQTVGQGSVMGAITSFLHGGLALDRGQVEAAVRHLREAAACLTVHDPGGGWTVQCGIALAEASALAGDVAGARSAIAVVTAAGRPGMRCFDPQITLARAWLAAVEGSVTEAAATALQAARQARSAGEGAVEVVALHTAARFGDRTVAGRLAQLSSHVHGPRAQVAAAHAAAVATDDGAALDRVARDWEEMGAVLHAADTAAQASGAHQRSGAQSQGIAAAAKAQRLAKDCGSARTPALAAAQRPLPLTRREREIASLVAAGLSNREIARRLVVSVRTVEGHVYNACSKLHVADRRGLCAVMA